MSIEIQDWLNRVTEVQPEKDVQKLVDDLVSTRDINLVSVFEQAQVFAGEYKKRGEEIPQDLVQAIQILSSKPSGFTGLTVFEAWIGFNKKS